MSILQPNFFQFPNVIADELMRHMTPAEFICLVVIIRKTRGWHKQADAISLSQFQEMTGIKSKRTIMRALTRLCSDEVGLVVAVKAPRTTTVYRLGEVFYVKKCTREAIAKIATALDAQKTPVASLPGAFNDPTIDKSINKGKPQKEKRADGAQVKPADDRPMPPTDQPPDKPKSADRQGSIPHAGEEVNAELEEIFRQLHEACKP